MQILKRWTHWLVVAFWLIYGVYFIVVSVKTQLGILQVIIGINTTLFGYFLLVRREGGPSPYPWYVQGIILFSIFLGNFYKIDHATPSTGTAIGIAGSLLSLWALFSLGKSFGIAPADRGLVMRGPYRLIRHPMYFGYLLIDLPVLIWNASIWNWGILILKVVSFAIRIVLEERVVSGYEEYSRNVRWRLIPFIW
jgi:protein-S-isoprenylcysteine O-methyltransferase Ste14